MWLSNRQKNQVTGEARAELGEVSLGGGQMAVYLSGERRNVSVISPGGYHWRPQLGEQVLVLKAGDQGEEPCIVGKPLTEVSGLEEGEVLIVGPDGENRIRLAKDGVIELTGSLYINGVFFQPSSGSGG